MHRMISITFLILSALLSPIYLYASAQRPFEDEGEGKCVTIPKRPIVVISDLHFGTGKDSKHEWDPTEDFRWSAELDRFLEYLPLELGDSIDLVIAGDLLELWQPVSDLVCKADHVESKDFISNAELGCHIEEMEKILDRVLEAHGSDLIGLGSFANKNNNRVFILPGNHDAAINQAKLWEKVRYTFGEVSENRLAILSDGIWSSDDCLIVIEHGNQIIPDVNRFDSWPEIVRDDFLLRPWGELFVQRLYNEKERDFPLIDNLIPESSGVMYFAQSQGIIGSIRDFSRFLFFNLFQTSFGQKGAFLGGTEEQWKNWDISYARTQLGHRLFTSAMHHADPLRKRLIIDEAQEWSDLRVYLDEFAKDEKVMPNSHVLMLCDLAAIRHAEEVANVISDGDKNKSFLCRPPKAGELLKRLFIPREWILRNHINNLLPKYPKMKAFIYGHTHISESTWTLTDLQFGRSVTISNSGAFQRVIDKETFARKAELKHYNPDVALGRLGFDDLPPCYSAIVVTYEDSVPKSTLRNWFDDAKGKFELTTGGDARCSKLQ